MRRVLSRAATLAVLVGCSSSVPEITYAQFLTELQAGNVDNIDIRSDQVFVILIREGSGRETCRVILPPGKQQGLSDVLEEHEVPFAVSEH